MRLHKNSKAMVRSPDSDTDFFDILAGVLQVDTFAPFLIIVCLDYVLRMSIDLMKENGITLKKQEAVDILQKLLRMQTT